MSWASGGNSSRTVAGRIWTSGAGAAARLAARRATGGSGGGGGTRIELPGDRRELLAHGRGLGRAHVEPQQPHRAVRLGGGGQGEGHVVPGPARRIRRIFGFRQRLRRRPGLAGQQQRHGVVGADAPVPRRQEEGGPIGLLRPRRIAGQVLRQAEIAERRGIAGCQRIGLGEGLIPIRLNFDLLQVGVACEAS